MKETQTVQEETIVIDLKLSRGLVVALSCILAVAALLAFLALMRGSAMASEGESAQAASAGMRQYYVTVSSGYFGNEVLGACADGYHMASLWEIADPSNLKYNTALGGTREDSGQGPPSFLGWVRTGYVSDVSDTAGQANCAGWTSVDSAHRGSVVSLPSNWSAGNEDVSVWDARSFPCDGSTNVWCIED